MTFRASILPLTIMVLTLVGCERKPLLPEQAPAEGTNYQEALEKNRERMQENRARDELDQAIRSFQTAMGRSPTNLVELVKMNYLTQVPDAPEGAQYIYDNQKGNVRLVRLSREQQSRLAQQKIDAELSSKAAEKE